MAALYSADALFLRKEPFYAFHVSGGTTECLRMKPQDGLFSIEKAAGTLDLNAGQLIEDEELRAQIKGSGIGTSATRAEILKKLNTIKYISINFKTQIITPTFLGEIIYDVVDNSIRHLLNPELTASWEKGLTGVAEGTITADEYMEKLDGFVSRRTRAVMALRNQAGLVGLFNETAKNYK